MTPEAKRIAIAEACPNSVEWFYGLPYWKGCWSAAGEGNEHFALFDPLNDLGAMHEAEKVLTREQIPEYVRLIWDQVSATCPDYINQAAFFIATATAAQRADAFLLTLGLLKP